MYASFIASANPRFLFAAYPELMDRVLRIFTRAISTHLAHQAGFTRRNAPTGAVTLIQRFGSALNLNIHFICCSWTG